MTRVIGERVKHTRQQETLSTYRAQLDFCRSGNLPALAGFALADQDAFDGSKDHCPRRRVADNCAQAISKISESVLSSPILQVAHRVLRETE